MTTRSQTAKRIDFREVRASSMAVLPALVRRWLPDGRLLGLEWVARNPRRSDRNLGSFKVNVRSGHWADFATGDKGGDAISLAAYLFSLSQREAAARLTDLLNISTEPTQ